MQGLSLRHISGNAVVDVTFKVTGENALVIIYNAKADKTTTFNMTNHGYFNLNGHASGSVYTHTLQINAEHYTPCLLYTSRCV